MQINWPNENILLAFTDKIQRIHYWYYRDALHKKIHFLLLPRCKKKNKNIVVSVLKRYSDKTERIKKKKKKTNIKKGLFIDIQL